MRFLLSELNAVFCNHKVLTVGINCRLLNLTHGLCLCPSKVHVFTHHTPGSILTLRHYRHCQPRAELKFKVVENTPVAHGR